MSFTAIILASARSQKKDRLQSRTLQRLLGDPILLWILRALPKEIKNVVLVVEPNDEREIRSLVEAWQDNESLKRKVHFINHPSQTKGIFNAFNAVRPLINKLKITKVLFLSGETPLITTKSLARLLRNCPAIGTSQACDPNETLGVVPESNRGNWSVTMQETTNKGKAILDGSTDATCLAIPWKLLTSIIKKSHGPRLPDLIHQLAQETKLNTIQLGHEEVLKINSKMDLSFVHALAQKIINNGWLERGVSILDPSSTFIGPRVELASDVLIEPNVSLLGKVIIGSGSTIQVGSRIEDSKLGNSTTVKPYTLIDKSKIGNHVNVGPFSRLREGTVLDERVQIGNFVETKKAKISKNSKANHLTYLGDVSIGTNTNVGAGVITCNYDGVNKHKTTIGNDVFIGSDTQMIAPINIGDGALIAAGTTLTDNVPLKNLAKSRVPQLNRPLKRVKR